MRTGRFKGKVLPTEAKCTVPNVLSFSWVWQDRNNMVVQFTVTIKDGDIDVECSMPDYRDADMYVLHQRAYDYCRAIISLHAFKMGYGLIVTLGTFITPTGREVTMIRTD